MRLRIEVFHQAATRGRRRRPGRTSFAHRVTRETYQDQHARTGNVTRHVGVVRLEFNIARGRPVRVVFRVFQRHRQIDGFVGTPPQR